MDTIGLDLHKRESQLCIGQDDGTVVERRIATTRERFTEVLGRDPTRGSCSRPARRVSGLPGILRRLGTKSLSPIPTSRRCTRLAPVARRPIVAMHEHSWRHVGLARIDTPIACRTRSVTCAPSSRCAKRWCGRVPGMCRSRRRWCVGMDSGSPIANPTSWPSALGHWSSRRHWPRSWPRSSRSSRRSTNKSRRPTDNLPCCACGPLVARLATAPAVGAITASAVVATVDDITRFASAHQFEAFLGLVPGERSSGEKRRIGAITKAGNARVRYLLVEAGWRILRSKSPETAALRAWALRIAARRGNRIAVVALARRLAGILFAMWWDTPRTMLLCYAHRERE